MKNIFFGLGFFLLLGIFIACEPTAGNTEKLQAGMSTQFTSNNAEVPPLSDDFNGYWYQGNAEISSYKLEQARYGEIHEGHAVLVFVTEDFSKSKQVKLDNAEAAGSDRVPILKLNTSKKFNTGVYPYSIMQSIFTPVSLDKYPHTLKTTMSSQEWCGHVFTQLNTRKDHYEVSGFSYFESEGDTKDKLKKVLLEDEIWTRIRINPTLLPVGKVELIPSVTYSRLRHRPMEVLQANISHTTQGENKVYSIEYPTEKRSLKIIYGKSFPHKIISWEEKYSSGWGAGAQVLTTKATLMETIKSDYWSRHSNSDLPLRTKLNLPN